MAVTTRPDIWGKVSEQYDAEPQEFELGLAKEICSVFTELGFRPGSKLLEAGCGSGHLSLRLNEAGYKTTLFDFEPKAIAAAQKAFLAHRRRGVFVEGDLFEIEKRVSTPADIVWNSGVLEHFDFSTLVSALEKMKSVARKGVFFIVPNPASVVYLLYRMKMLHEERWNVGVEFLRTDYEHAIAKSGLHLVQSAPCGREYTRHSVRVVSQDPAIRSLFDELVESGQFAGNVQVLQYFYCSTTGGSGTTTPAVSEDAQEQSTFDRTFYLDALGTVNSALLNLRRERDRLQAERDGYLGSQEGLRQALRDEQTKSKDALVLLEKQLAELKTRYEQAIAAEAAGRQAALDQRAASEQTATALNEKAGLVETRYERILAIETEHRRTVEAQLAKSQAASSSLEDQLSSLTEKSDKLRATQETERRSADEEKSKFQATIASLETKLAVLSARHEELLATGTQMRQSALAEQGRVAAEMASLGEKLQLMTQKYEQAITAEAAQRQIGTQLRAQLESTVSSLDEKIKTLGARLEKSIASEASERQAALDQKKIFEKELASLQEEIDGLAGQRAVDREEKQSARDRIRELQSEIREMQEDSARLASTLSAHQESSRREQVRLEEYRNAISSLVSSLRETVNRGQELFERPSYRFFWFVIVARHALFGGSWKTMLAFFRLLAARLRGKAGALAEFLYLDPLWEILQRLRRNLEEYQKFFTPQVTSPAVQPEVEGRREYLPELRRAVRSSPSTSKKRVAYFTNQLLDWYDRRPRHGGGERYCLMLTTLLNELGFDVDLYQIAASSFEGEYYGHKVRAIPGGEWYSEFNLGAARTFYELSRDYDHVIYNMPELSAGPMRTDAVSVCHGIWFDHNNYGSGVKFREALWYQHLQRAFTNPRTIVSVDTNSINVIRTLWPEAAGTMRWIPNFVDTTMFKPPESRPESPLVVLFPRRSQINRGSRLLEEILHRVSHDVQFHWVGEGDDPDTKIIKDLSVRDRRLEFSVASFEDMPNWFTRAHICVIPTIACEGTSLACLEALASGCAIVSTNVGGLPDIIQDRSNGLLVDPTAEAIADGINELIGDRELRTRLSLRGAESAQNFSIDRWRERWRTMLQSLRWIEPQRPTAGPGKGAATRSDLKPQPRIVIVTRNGYHGGVETLVHMESLGLNAPVIVAGGLDDPQRTCPFFYTYVASYEELRKRLNEFDVVLYHWPLDWAVAAIKDSGLPSVEYVHRKDTAECDKSAASVVITHSRYLADFLKEKFRVDARVTNNVVDLKKFYPAETPGSAIGSVTSYFDTKGIDVFIRALAYVGRRFRNIPVELFGAGTEREKYAALARSLKVDAKFNPPTSRPLEAYHALGLYVSAARIEGLPLSVLEALACNIPVIASDIEGHAVINRLAKAQGLPEPILLFRSEDEHDLARKIEDVQGGYRLPKGRDIVERLFSPDTHLTDVRSAVNDAVMKKARRPIVDWDLLDDCENTGTLLTENGGEGFFQRIGGKEDKFLHPSNSGRLPESSFEGFICYRYRYPRDTERLSCLMQCAFHSEGTVHVQFDWHDRGWSLVKMQGFGRLLDSKTTELYVTAPAPPEAAKSQGYVNIVFRPNTGFMFTIQSVRIQAWKKVLKR
ncbi:MAG TPA: glycosyltransferase [Bacteroidota bacterium]|nr:glycosyltransferase [Bacteroidota bacterium]